MERIRNFLKKSKNITRLMLFLAVLEMVMVLYGTYQLWTSSENLQRAEEARYEYRNGSEALEECSDYLTREARLFAVTGDVEHFRNYWYEAEEEKQRENVIEEMEKANLPMEEENLLARAKYFSDTLMHIEISSMRLTLESRNIAKEEYSEDTFLQKWMDYVKSYPLESDFKLKKKSQKKEMAVQILFGSSYEKYKEIIDNNIGQFQEKMEKRLNGEVNKAQEQTRQAGIWQIVFVAGEMLVLVLIFISFHKMYIQPLLRYTDTIDLQQHKRQFFIEPEGVWELERFGEVFNQLSSDLLEELNHREEVERQLRAAKEEADEANQTKSNFLAQISHEIRTPLNAVLGYLFLLENTKLSGEQRRYAGNMHMAADILLEEINEILDFTKIESGKMLFERKNIDLFHMVEELKSVLENEGKKRGLSMDFQVDEDVPRYLKADALRLKQILTNLLFNGLKFTKEGSVSLFIHARRLGKNSCTLEFVVKDTGIGIKREQQLKIFDAFAQSDASITRKYGGTGLGLPICKRMIEEASNGRYTLLLESKEGMGSQFFFTLDFAYGEMVEIQEKEAKRSVEKRESLPVLIVDDNQINLVMEREILHKFGYEADVESDPHKVMGRMEQKKYALVFLDISMPELSGFDVCRMIRERKEWASTIVIALTANIGDDVVEKVQEAGMNDYLSKPIPIERLRELLEKYTDCLFDETITEDDEEAEDAYVSIEKLKDLLNGDEAAVKELLEIFLEDNGQFEKKVLEYVQVKDNKALEMELHRIKGVSGNLQCGPLEQIAWKCMEAVKEEKEWSREYKELLDVFQKTMEEIRRYIEK